MDEDVETIFMEDESTSADSVPPSYAGKAGGYRNAMIEILQCIKEEVDPDLLGCLKIQCFELGMDAEAFTELLSKKSILNVFSALLEHCNNDLRRVIPILNKFIPEIIHDFQDKEKLQSLSDTIVRENEVFGLTQTSPLHGRNNELEQLIKFVDFEKAADTRVVNVCGMAGIGKSFLVKHFGSRLLNEQGYVVIYVDVSGVGSLHDMQIKILQNPHVNRPASSNEDVLGTFYGFLSDNNKEKFVLILDDLSSLMPNSDIKLTNDVLSWVNNFTKSIHDLKIQLKLVVTSQIRFTILQEKLEPKEWLKNKKHMKDYTKDLPLGNLSVAVAKRFLGSSLQSLSDLDKEHLVKLCDGHPYSLHFMCALAESGYTISTEINKITAKDVSALNAELADMMFPKAFERLTERQKLVLFAVALFDRDAQLGALHYILNPKESCQTFMKRVKEDFSNSFWLTFRAHIKTKRTVANMHHPLIMKYIKNQLDLHMEGDNNRLFVELQRRYILYHINDLVEIGRECVPSSPKLNFLQSTNKKLMEKKSNFKLALGRIAKSKDPSLLFCEHSAGKASLRQSSDIVHLFLCLHQYNDWLDGSVMHMLRELISQDIGDVCHRVLLHTLNVMMLAVEQNWTVMDRATRKPVKENDPQLIADVSPELFDFCKAIYGYSEGRLYTHAPFYRERKDGLLIDKRSLALRDAFRYLDSEELPDSWSGVRNYFCVQILLVKAESTWAPDTKNVAVIREAFAFCKQARDLIHQAVILEPAVYAELASYQAIEGDQYDDIPTASRLYEESRSFHKKVMQLHKTYKIERTSAAARHFNDYAVLMRSWANLLTEHDPVPDDHREKALSCLKIAVKHASKAADIFKVMSGHSKAELLKSLFDTADSLERLQYETPRTDMVSRVTYQSAALKYYNDVYKLIKADYRRCSISANDFTLNRLMQRLPELMRMHNLPRESIDKVKDILSNVQHAAVKAAEAALNLSGSESGGSGGSSSSSDMDSPDEEWVNESEMFKLDHILSGPYFSDLPVQPAADESQPSAVVKMEDSTEEEGGSAVRKRPRV